jgi:hypothetical protein
LNEKYAEGQRLIATGDFSAGIYLLGYAAEMLLKNAYFRFTGASLLDEVEPRLSPAKTAGRDKNGNGLIPNISCESYHSLRFWAMLLQAKRIQQGRPWPDSRFTLEFERCTESLHNNWWVEMRYRRSVAKPEESLQILSDVGWLRTHQTVLWS